MLGWAAVPSLIALPAYANTTHVVARGHTVEAIAHRYHVTPKAVIDANHLKDPRHLKVGETLVIPGVVDKGGNKGKGGPSSKTAAHPKTYAARAKTPGVVHATRLSTTETFSINTKDRRGRLSPVAIKTFEKLLKTPGGQSHVVDARLVTLLSIVSDHFGSRKVEVVSGYRPYTPTQHTPHSNHNVGHAIDFRVAGVPNEVVRDFCRTLKNVGVGYYPNSTFVHLDTRSAPAYWIDYSRPGEPPRYNSPNADADEGTSDVGDEAKNAPPPASPTQDEGPSASSPASVAPSGASEAEGAKSRD